MQFRQLLENKEETISSTRTSIDSLLTGKTIKYQRDKQSKFVCRAGVFKLSFRLGIGDEALVLWPHFVGEIGCYYYFA